MINHLLRLLTVIVVIILTTDTLSASPNGFTFKAILNPGVLQAFPLELSRKKSAYVVDVTPLEESVNGAYVHSVVHPEFNGKEWVDVLRVIIPDGIPKLRVKIDVYKPGNLTTVFDWTDNFPPGEWRGYVIDSVNRYSGVYLTDLDPLAASIKGAYIGRYLIHPEFPWGSWLDILRVQTAINMPSSPLPIRMRVYLASDLPLVSEVNGTFSPADTWNGFIIGPSSLRRGYIVRAKPLTTEYSTADLNQFIIQPEFNGQQWNDVLRVEMRGPSSVQIDYNFKIYACDKNSCPTYRREKK